MRRRRLVLALAAVAGGVALPSRAQKAGRNYRVAALMGGGGLSVQPFLRVLSERLATHGFVEGRNLRIEARGAAGMFHQDREAVRELLAGKPDAIFAATGPGAQAAQAATNKVPIVFTWVDDPVALGLVNAYARPGGNATGATSRVGELLVKRLELARELVPGAKRIAAVGYVQGAEYAAMAARLRKAAASLGLELIETPAGGEYAAAVGRAAKAGAEAVLLLASIALQPVSGERIIQHANQIRVPVVYADAAAAESGGLISFGTDLAEDMRRGADMLARVLRGDSPATLAVDQAARFELVVNLKTARAMGLTVPQSVLVRADRVIE